MLPWPVFLIKTAGWVQGVTFIVISNREASRLLSEDVTSTTIGPPGVLLAYRLVMLAWALFIGVRQYMRRGLYLFVFFTVWNWWMLTLFFALGSAASLRAWLRRRSAGARAQVGQPGQQHVDVLEKAVMATFMVEMPMALVIDGMTWLVLVPMLVAAEQDPKRRTYWLAVHHNFDSYNLTLVIDALTWLVLVPMLMDSPDPAQVKYWQERLYCFESYNQHGFNIVMMLGDLLLNRIPVGMYDSGWLACWASLYGVWSAIFYSRTGRFIYPFLDAHKPYSWLTYIGLYAVHWLAYFFVLLLVRTKNRLLLKGGLASEPAAASLLSAPKLKSG